MQITHAKIISVLNKAQALREEMGRVCVGQIGPRLSMRDLHIVVESFCDLRIEIIEVTFPARHLKGKVERYNDKRARILVRAGLSPNETRFVAAKELSHLVIAESVDWSTLGVDTISELLTDNMLSASDGNGILNPTVPAQSEVLAMIAACELLYPREFREPDVVRRGANETSVTKIALEHDVPAYLIEYSHKHNSLISSLWCKIDSARKAA